MERKQKGIVPELVWMRSIACLAVVLLSAATLFLTRDSLLSARSGHWLIALNTLLLFAGPAFAFMSAFLIGHNDHRPEMGQVLWRRVKYLLLPFIVFAGLYAAWGTYDGHFAFGQRLSENLRGNYEGYFILIVLQFYVVHLILGTWLEKLRPGVALIGAGAINILYLLVLNRGLLPLPNLGYNLFPAWVFYYALGFYTGRRPAEFRAYLRRNAGWLAAYTAAAVAGLLYLILGGAQPGVSSHSLKVLFYAPGAICLFFYFAGNSRRVPALLSVVNRYSLGIYLWHLLLIDLMWRLGSTYLVLFTPAGVAVLWGASIAGSILLTALISRVKLGAFLVGQLGLDYRQYEPSSLELPAWGRLLVQLGVVGAFLYWIAIKQLWVMHAIGIDPSRQLLLATLAPTLVLVSPALFLKGRQQIAALLGADFVITFIGYANLVYYRQFRDLVTAATVRFAGQLGEVKGAVWTLLHWGDLRYFADVLLLAALLLIAWLAPRIRLPRWSVPRRGWIALTGMVVGISLTASFIIHDPGRAQTWAGPTAIAKRLGLLNYQAEDLWRYGSLSVARMHPSSQAVAQVKDWFTADSDSESGEPAQSPLYGSAKGDNVIYLQVESLHNFVLGLKVNGQEVTPNLNKLAGESIHFTDFYTQIGQGTTSDAEFLTNCSMYPASSGSVYVQYAGNQFSCLSGLLKNNGYQTLVMHADRPDFWNRANIYPNLGWETFVHDTDYVQDGKVGAWLGDASFLRQSAAKLAAMPQPFQAMVITVSSHAPYEGNGVPHTLNLGSLEGTEAGDYLQTIHYVDAAIGDFVNQLKQNGLFDHSIMTVYGDHTVLRRETSGLADLLQLSPQDQIGWAKVENQVPFLIHVPNVKAAVRTDPAGEIDMAPTVAGLLGLPTADTFFMGRNLFDGTAGNVVLHDGSTITPNLMYLAQANGFTGACYSRPSGETLPTSDCAQISQQAREAQGVSSQILNLNLRPQGG